MKKYLFGIFAIVLAIGFSAFTTTKSAKSKKIDSYWFVATNSTSTISSVQLDFPTSAPTAQSADPFSCEADGSKYCSLPFPNIVYDNGVYKPSANGSTVLAPINYGTNLNDDPVLKTQ